MGDMIKWFFGGIAKYVGKFGCERVNKRFVTIQLPYCVTVLMLTSGCIGTCTIQILLLFGVSTKSFKKN